MKTISCSGRRQPQGFLPTNCSANWRWVVASNIIKGGYTWWVSGIFTMSLVHFWSEAIWNHCCWHDRCGLTGALHSSYRMPWRTPASAAPSSTDHHTTTMSLAGGCSWEPRITKGHRLFGVAWLVGYLRHFDQRWKLKKRARKLPVRSWLVHEATFHHWSLTIRMLSAEKCTNCDNPSTRSISLASFAWSIEDKWINICHICPYIGNMNISNTWWYKLNVMCQIISNSLIKGNLP